MSPELNLPGAGANDAPCDGKAARAGSAAGANAAYAEARRPRSGLRCTELRQVVPFKPGVHMIQLVCALANACSRRQSLGWAEVSCEHRGPGSDRTMTLREYVLGRLREFLDQRPVVLLERRVASSAPAGSRSRQP